MDLNEIKSALRKGLVTIVFTKVTGARRVMVATLDEAHGVPPTSSDQTRVKDPDLLVVWDTQHAGWRSIRADSIIEWNAGDTSDAVSTGQQTTVIGAWAPNTPVPSSGQ